MFFLALNFFFLIGPQASTAPAPDQITVYIFLHEACIISQHYTLNLKEYHATYASDHLVFKGIFPNAHTDEMDMLIFRGKYELPFDMVKDEQQALTKKFDAQITPEVVVYNESQEKILYKGRIDDTYFRVGKKRRVTTTSELKDVLEAIVNNQPIITASTEAIGCFIKRN